MQIANKPKTDIKDRI